MSRFAEAEPILNAAKSWADKCLMEGGSLFSDEKLWTERHFNELKTYYVDRPIEGNQSFQEKLEIQLRPASPEAKRLWAEITWLYYLIVNKSVKGVTKLDKIRKVWESSGATLLEDHPLLGEILDQGVANPGRPFKMQQWKEFRFIINTMLDWCQQSPHDRKLLLNDPWRFAEYLDEKPDSSSGMRHALLWLLFPDEFEDTLTLQHKQAIVAGLKDESQDMSYKSSSINTDRALLEIKKRLVETYRDEEISFYDDRLLGKWRPTTEIEPDSDTWFKKTVWNCRRLGARTWRRREILATIFRSRDCGYRLGLSRKSRRVRDEGSNTRKYDLWRSRTETFYAVSRCLAICARDEDW